jgi:hypothetical protein
MSLYRGRALGSRIQAGSAPRLTTHQEWLAGSTQITDGEAVGGVWFHDTGVRRTAGRRSGEQKLEMLRAQPLRRCNHRGDDQASQNALTRWSRQGHALFLDMDTSRQRGGVELMNGRGWNTVDYRKRRGWCKVLRNFRASFIYATPVWKSHEAAAQSV